VTTSVSFKEAVLSLEVTPQITPDDRIIMTLKVTQDSVGQVVQRRSEYRHEPGQDTGAGRQRADRSYWRHLQRSGDKKQTEKTPFLGDLPYVGRLFRKTLDKTDKQELLIFITPRIIQDSLTTR